MRALHLPLRWQFIPVEQPSDRSIRWTWRAYTQTRQIALHTDRLFDTLTECMEDARRSGYEA